MIRLPVSGIEVELRPPAGREEVLLLEASALDVGLALALADRLASISIGPAPDWGDLSVTDLDALLLNVRSLAFGDVLRAEARCPSESCGAAIDVNFRITEYLTQARPRTPRNAEPASAEDWYRLRASDVTFRVPTVRDQLAAASEQQPRRALVRRCVRPTDASAAAIGRVELALAALAPPLAGDLSSRCPDCGDPVTLYFDPRQFVLRELREQAAFVYEDVHLLASQYGWSEEAILGLPRARRAQYAELVRSERRGA